MLINRLDELQNLVRRGIVDLPDSGIFEVLKVGNSLLVCSVGSVYVKPNVASLWWDSQGYATEIIETLIANYRLGHSISSDTGVAYGIPNQGIPLRLSFGRQKGHTTAILNFYRNHPELNLGIVASTSYLKQVFEQDIPRSAVFCLEDAEAIRGRNFDMLLFDLCSSTLGTSVCQDFYNVARESAIDIVILCGDLNGEFPSYEEKIGINIY